MNILSSNDINILDLPDEMLHAIFNNLSTVDILYSLVDVDQRFTRLALDPLVIRHLDFVIKQDDLHDSSVNTKILDRICSKILPRINEKVEKLTVDQFSMERIIDVVDYSQLHSLSLEKLINLKCFSLRTNWYTSYYDEQVVPLLRRMLNLEELTLLLPVRRYKSTYIDGNHLYDQVLNYMPQLNKFIFNIHTEIIHLSTDIDVPSNDDIRNSFIKRGFQSVEACADKKSNNIICRCHVYSLPYQFDEFMFMGKCFQGGRFDKVRMLSMHDEHPFEHELFKIISQDFPFLQKLSIWNFESPKKEQHYSSTLIIFNYLFELDLMLAHSDYAIQFLSDTKTRLLCLTNLRIEYETLATVTNNFTNDATRLNCAKIKSLVMYRKFVPPHNFFSYFSSSVNVSFI
ncbi:unnamed protein product [Adineta steineri]|uniref:F-box domain-containing protein n=1 Tax=Adineta steineri TaxID=433720 RepID=A0A813RWK2_9BILA|nr:unnamed protein product [Adineta steineri]